MMRLFLSQWVWGGVKDVQKHSSVDETRPACPQPDNGHLQLPTADATLWLQLNASLQGEHGAGKLPLRLPLNTVVGVPARETRREKETQPSSLQAAAAATAHRAHHLVNHLVSF